VQSGFKPNQAVQGRRYNFTAPVALHNNVAGYLGVTLEVPRRSKQDELFLICWALAVSLCMLTLWWSIQRQWWSQLRTKIPSAADMVTAVVDKIPTMAEAETAPINVEKTAPKQVFVRLSVKLININTLHQQLNSESFFTLIQRFEKQLQSLLQLYSGHHQRLSGDMLYVDFSGEEFHECSFRAVCCAQILINMASTSSSPRLQLSATVQPIASTQALNGSALIKEFMTQKSNTLTPAKYEIMVSNSLLDETLQHHCEFELESGKLLHIKPPFSDYVNKQEAQLLQR
jgi:hypothetical protein